MKSGLMMKFEQCTCFKIVKVKINTFNGYFVLDLNVKKSVLNARYFCLSSHVRHLYPIVIHWFKCYFLEKKNLELDAIDLSKYEKEHRMIYGVLGQDLLKGYTLNEEDLEQEIIRFKEEVL